MKITAFLGSPRAGGNTDTFAQCVLDGATAAGLETQSVAFRKLRIHDCSACDKCWEKRGRPCAWQDEMDELYDIIIGSDILLFATPVYWYAPTAIMKAFIDRLVPFNRPQGKPLIEGKRAILVTAYEEEGPGAVEPMVKMFELSFAYLGLRFTDRIIVDGTGPRGAILNKPEALAQAYRLGSILMTND